MISKAPIELDMASLVDQRVRVGKERKAGKYVPIKFGDMGGNKGFGFNPAQW